MSEIASKLFANMYFLTAVILFLIGLYIMLAYPDMIKKVIGMNIMDTAVFLHLVSTGYIRGGVAPIVIAGSGRIYVNPLPSALILTGIVVAVSVSAFALALTVKLYQYYGTTDIDEIARLRGASHE